MSSPAPTTESAAAFLDAVARSRLFAGPKLSAWRAEAEAEQLTAETLGAKMTAAGDLTPFQSAKLMLGQWHGLRLGPYSILNPLGRGGMGVVYIARNLETADQQLVALKILPPGRAAEVPRTAERFRREMALGAIVPDHPNLARMLASGVANGVNYIAMDFVPGKTLKAAVAAGGRLTVPVAARVLADTARGLQAAHGTGIIHRDLKPSNVMITPTGTAKLLDFGLAVRVGEEWPDDPRVVGGAGYAVGTMDYIAPEQAENATAVTPASDLYALGGTLYFALAGCPPFPGGTSAQKIKWHRTESPPPLRTLNPDVTPELASIVTRLMAKNPADRPESAAAVARELEKWTTGPVELPAAVVAPTAEAVELTDEDEWSRDEPLPSLAASLLPPEFRVPYWVWIAMLAVLVSFGLVAGFVVRLVTR